MSKLATGPRRPQRTPCRGLTTSALGRLVSEGNNIYIYIYIYIHTHTHYIVGVDIYIYIIYIYIYIDVLVMRSTTGDDTVANPHRAQISQFKLFELILLLKLDKQFPVEQFEPTVSQSTVPSPLLSSARDSHAWRGSAAPASWLLRVYYCCVQRTRFSRVAFTAFFSATCLSCLFRAQAVSPLVCYIPVYVYVCVCMCIYTYIHICIHLCLSKGSWPHDTKQ